LIKDRPQSGFDPGAQATEHFPRATICHFPKEMTMGPAGTVSRSRNRIAIATAASVLHCPSARERSRSAEARTEEANMANESSDVGAGKVPPLGGVAPGLAGVHGRLRIEVAGKPVGTLVVEGTHVELTSDTTGPADAIGECATDDDFRKLLKGELNVFIASMRGWARLRGDRNFGTKVVLGLQAGSPFAAAFGKGG
jgi:hypothetical protein